MFRRDAPQTATHDSRTHAIPKLQSQGSRGEQMLGLCRCIREAAGDGQRHRGWLCLTLTGLVEGGIGGAGKDSCSTLQHFLGERLMLNWLLTAARSEPHGTLEASRGRDEY